MTVIKIADQFYSDNQSIANFYGKNHTTVSRWVKGQEFIINEQDGKTKYRLLNGVERLEDMMKAINEEPNKFTIITNIADLQTIQETQENNIVVANKMQSSNATIETTAITTSNIVTNELEDIANKMQSSNAIIETTAITTSEEIARLQEEIARLQTVQPKTNITNLNISDLFRSNLFKSIATFGVIGITASMCYLELMKNQSEFGLEIPSWLVGALASLLAVMVGTSAANWEKPTTDGYIDWWKKVNWSMFFFNIVEVASAASFFQLHKTDFKTNEFNLLLFIVTVLFTLLLPIASAFLNKSLKK